MGLWDLLICMQFTIQLNVSTRPIHGRINKDMHVVYLYMLHTVEYFSMVDVVLCGGGGGGGGGSFKVLVRTPMNYGLLWCYNALLWFCTVLQRTSLALLCTSKYYSVLQSFSPVGLRTEVQVSLFAAGAALGELLVSLFMAGAALGEGVNLRLCATLYFP